MRISTFQHRIARIILSSGARSPMVLPVLDTGPIRQGTLLTSRPWTGAPQMSSLKEPRDVRALAFSLLDGLCALDR